MYYSFASLSVCLCLFPPSFIVPVPLYFLTAVPWVCITPVAFAVRCVPIWLHHKELLSFVPSARGHLYAHHSIWQQIGSSCHINKKSRKSAFLLFTSCSLFSLALKHRARHLECVNSKLTAWRRVKFSDISTFGFEKQSTWKQQGAG